MSKPMSSAVPRLSAGNSLVLASARDRARLENGPLGGLTLFIEPDADAASLLHNVFPLLAVAVSGAGRIEIERIANAVRKVRSVPELPILHLETETLDADASLIREVLEKSVLRLAELTSSITAELAMLRRERENLFENYRALEDAFRARNWEPGTEIFAHDPFTDAKEGGLGEVLSESGLEQLLPVSSYGISGFALHFRKLTEERGELIITLEYVESGEGVAEWIVPFVNIAADWNYFSLPKACDGSARTLRLRLTATGGQPPELSLGHPIANDRYAARARFAQGDLGYRPLAFRLFTGVPGVRPTGVVNMFGPNVLLGGRRVEDYRLPKALLLSVADVSVTESPPGFQAVYFLNLEDAIVCHPVREGVSAAALSGAIVPGTVRLSARAHIGDPKGQPTDVGLLIAQPGIDLRGEITRIGRSCASNGPAVFSGWREATSEQPININVTLSAPVEQTMDLIVLSRATNESVDFSWLKVFDFRMVKHFGADA